MPLIIDSPDQLEHSETITASGLETLDPRIGPNEDRSKEEITMSHTVKVRALVDHQDGSEWRPVGAEYAEEAMRARDKATRRIVQIIDDGKAKSAGPSENKSTAPAADKAKAAPKKKAAKSKAKAKS